MCAPASSRGPRSATSWQSIIGQQGTVPAPHLRRAYKPPVSRDWGLVRVMLYCRQLPRRSGGILWATRAPCFQPDVCRQKRALVRLPRAPISRYPRRVHLGSARMLSQDISEFHLPPSRRGLPGHLRNPGTIETKIQDADSVRRPECELQLYMRTIMDWTVLHVAGPLHSGDTAPPRHRRCSSAATLAGFCLVQRPPARSLPAVHSMCES